MVKLVLKKMFNNFWLFFSLLVGCILITAMVSSIPMYTDGILQRLLIQDLEAFQTDKDIYPGNYEIEASYFLRNKYKEYNKVINNNILPQIKLPVICSSKEICLNLLNLMPEKQREEKPKERFAYITSLSGIKEHVAISNGRLYSEDIKDGVIEAIVTRGLLKNLDLRLNETYIAKNLNLILPYKIKIVGVIEMKDLNDPFWIKNISSYDKNLFIDENLLYDEFMEKGKGKLFYKGKWNMVFDYHSITLKNLESIVKVFEAHTKWFKKNNGIKNNIVCMNVLKEYNERHKQLIITLWILIVPVIFVMLFYIFMVSQLILKSEQNEIAVLKSRGATKGQILKIYFAESFILCVISILVGPFLGVFLCKIIGTSNGFLSFVNRKALPININLTTYIYCTIALFIMILTMMIPAYRYSKTTIVQHKQQRKNRSKLPIWQKVYLDVIIFALSLYGLYRYRNQQSILQITGVKGTDIQIDPLVFLTSTLFILGAGLIFLRIFPLLINFIFFLGKKVWTPSVYMAFTQVSRSRGQEQFIMLFLIFVMSVGIFSANAARTINRNIEDRIRYEIGSDILIQEDWGQTLTKTNIDMISIQNNYTDEVDKSIPKVYTEPPFSKFSKLSGVKSATKVYVKEDGKGMIGTNSIENVQIMGIIPHEFGEIAWFRNDLLPYHIYEYLNVLTSTPNAMLISTNARDKFKVKLGDSISIKVGDEYVDGVVFGFVDYWPTYNPYTIGSVTLQKYLVVGNLTYFQDSTAIQPYKVWIKKDIVAKDEMIYKDIEDKGIKIIEIKNSNQEIIKKKNDPMLQGINGALTLAFLITMIISFVGFLIYWILSIHGRILQFGVLRGLGLSLGEVIRSIIYEHILISGTALITGIIIGGLTSDLFVPLFQLVFSAKQQVPPFHVIASRHDYMKIYIIVASMLILGLGVLSKIISRINIGQALKLGED